MKRLLALTITALLAASSSHVAAQGASDITLKKPSAARMDLADALEARKSTRAFAEKPLSADDLGAILWAANGINRPGGKRTAPAAYGRQYIKLYLVSEEGA